MELDLNLFHLISHFGRFYFALLLIIRPMYFGKRTCLYRGSGCSFCLARSCAWLAISCRILSCWRGVFLPCLEQRVPLGLGGTSTCYGSYYYGSSLWPWRL